MSESSEGDADLLRRVIAATPVGRQELREPLSGLSLQQRWLLAHVDGESALADLARVPGCPPMQRLPRDAARLVGLGLAVDMGDPGPSTSVFGPTTIYGEMSLPLPLGEAEAHSPAGPWSPRRSEVSRPRAWIVGAALLAVGGGAAAWLLGGAPSGPVPAGAAATAAAASAASAAEVPAATAGLPAAPASAAPVAAAGASQAARPELTLDAVLAALTVTPKAPPPVDAPGRPGAAAEPAVPARPPAQQPAPAGARAAEAGAPATLPAPSPAPVPTPAPAPAAAPAYVAAPTAGNAGVPAAAAPVVTPAVPSPGGAATAQAAPQTAAARPPAGTAPAGPSTAPAPAVVAAAQPAAVSYPPSPAAPAAPLRPVSVVEPAFPREGYGLGGRTVLLTARLTLAPNGSVSEVSFANPSSTNRPFERAARTALLQWRFPEGSGERVVQQQVRFSEE